MTEKQDEFEDGEVEMMKKEIMDNALEEKTCENCGQKEPNHKPDLISGCKKFKAKTSLGKKPKGCGKEWKMWNPETEKYMYYGKCRPYVLCNKCEPKNQGTFNLSEKIWGGNIPVNYVKEFISRLKGKLEKVWDLCDWVDCDGGGHDEIDIINKLAGEELVK
jgi:hypothetical protein